jgi:hypothetical protein
MEKPWHCYLCVRQEMIDNVLADHEYLGLVMINGTTYCLFHARGYAHRSLSRAARSTRKAVPGKLATRRIERGAEKGT